jgi:hypothetical protein
MGGYYNVFGISTYEYDYVLIYSLTQRVKQ